MEEIVSSVQDITATRFLLFIFAIIITLVLSGAIANFVKNILTGHLKKSVARVVSKVTLYAFYFIGFSYSLTSIINFNLPAVLAALGVLGAFCFVPTIPVLQNAISGIVITFTRPLKEGDFVDVGGELCLVEDISLLKTKVLSMNGRIIFVPNLSLINGNIVNYTKGKYERVTLTIDIKNTVTFEQAKEVINDVCTQMQKIVSEEMLRRRNSIREYFEEMETVEDVNPKCYLKSIGAEKLSLDISYWIVDFSEKSEIISEFNENLIEHFAKNGITLA